MNQAGRGILLFLLISITGCFMDSRISTLNPASESSTTPGAAQKLVSATEMVS